MLHIFTLHYNKKPFLVPLKNSLLNALKNIDFKWWVKDNASTDGSIEELKSWNHKNINVIYFENNKQNYSQGMNFLFKEANPSNNDLILTLNNDITIQDSKSIINMINVLKSNKDIGLVGAKLNYNNTNKIQHCGVLFHHYNRLPYHFRAGEIEASRDQVNRYFPAATGAVSLLSADTYQNCFKNTASNTVGFNEEYFWCFDDIDMNMRITQHLKKKIVCCGTTSIFHEESASLKSNPVHSMFLRHNANKFLTYWGQTIDRNLLSKYADEKYGLYIAGNL